MRACRAAMTLRASSATRCTSASAYACAAALSSSSAAACAATLASAAAIAAAARRDLDASRRDSATASASPSMRASRCAMALLLPASAAAAAVSGRAMSVASPPRPLPQRIATWRVATRLAALLDAARDAGERAGATNLLPPPAAFPTGEITGCSGAGAMTSRLLRQAAAAFFEEKTARGICWSMCLGSPTRCGRHSVHARLLHLVLGAVRGSRLPNFASVGAMAP